ncbi:diacylglycerol kinase family lipid kinase [soil metagenome]
MAAIPEIPVILNPSARSERSRSLASRIRALSDNVRVYETTGPGHARELASQFARGGEPKVVAAGGDGTINEVVNGLAEGGLERGSSLGLLPTGTMNVFATELGIPSSHRLADCWEIIEGDCTARVDLWCINDHYFVQLAGVGLDADIIKETTWDRKKAFGPLSYVMSAAQLFAKDPPKVVVRHPEGADVEGAIVLLGNGQRYGGPFRIFRNASNSDGLLDCIVIKEPSYPQFLELLAAASLTGFENAQTVDYFQTDSLTIESAGPAPVAVEADGDLVGETPVTVRKAAWPIKVLVPPERATIW